MDNILFGQVEKNLQSNHGVLKSINQSESSVSYKKVFVFFDTNHSESSITYDEIFIFFDINQSELSVRSHVIFVVLSNQNKLFIDFKLFFWSEQNYVYETSQSIIFLEKISNITNIYIWHQNEIDWISCLVYIIFSILNSNFEVSIKKSMICSISYQWKKKLPRYTFLLFSFCSTNKKNGCL